ncbi:MAG TPA: hypothetical protein VMR97_06045 [Acidimicrobiales bacterium]|nr:hypothetical protein [Acidimicrobiales bacterium]
MHHDATDAKDVTHATNSARDTEVARTPNLTDTRDQTEEPDLADATDEADTTVVDNTRAGQGLALLRRVGCGLLGLQLVSLLVFSAVQFSRYSATSDYAYYSEAWYRFAHFQLPAGFLGNHGEVTFILLAPTYWLWPHGPILLWDQDIAVVAAEVVAFLWICDVVGSRRETSRHMGWLLAGTGLVALLADPWIWWSLAFDFHYETVATLYAVLFARDLLSGRRRAWLWGGMTLLSGDYATTYVVAIGICALVGSRHRLSAAAATASGAVGLVVLHSLGAMRGSGNLAPLTYLAGRQPRGAGHSVSGLVQLSFGLLLRPGHLLEVMWSKRLNAWANLAASGLLGILAPTILFVLLAVITENSLYPGIAFNQPLFQSIPIYVFGPVGAVVFLAWVARRYRWLAAVLAVSVMAETIGWGAVWLPRTPGQWIRVPAAAAAEIDRFEKALPVGAEVVASQGIGGRFAAGHFYVAIVGPGGSVRLAGQPVWFVITPAIGVETAPVASEYALVAELAADPLQARPVAIGHGVWSYEYTPPAGQSHFDLPGIPTSVPAWLLHSTSGVAVTSGPPFTWRVVSTGRAGYLVFGGYWREPAGPAVATAELSGHGQVSVEVWDDTTHTLLARIRPPLVGETVKVRIPFEVPKGNPAPEVFHGWGPFRLNPSLPPPGNEDELEVRVYTPGPGTKASAYSVGISG